MTSNALYQTKQVLKFEDVSDLVIYNAVEQYLFPFIVHIIKSVYARNYSFEDAQLNAKFAELSGPITCIHLEVKNKFWLTNENTTSEKSYKPAIDCLRKISTSQSIDAHLNALVLANKAIVKCIHDFHKNSDIQVYVYVTSYIILLVVQRI